ncbi:hypothetical protein B0T16DRAFT_450644 [Cercophora newfieldiana]|uniref:Uncharacterized protein n=1 Tax=Cercophora newfieldiana TaxID=92897 RepID=A0AA39YM20_9PEZI|nr:hypothetical protein B0T16DRAFT_450644 [Cercophora newfieldiana]
MATPTWFKRLGPRVKFARERDRPLPDDMFDADMTDIGEDSDPEAPKNPNDIEPCHGRDQRLYYELKAERDERKHQLRVDRRITKAMVERDQEVEPRVMAEWNSLRDGDPRFIHSVSGKRFEIRCSRHSALQEFWKLPDKKFLQFYHLPDWDSGLSGYIFMEKDTVWTFRMEGSVLPGYAGRHGCPTVVVKATGPRAQPRGLGRNEAVRITFISDNSVAVEMPQAMAYAMTEAEMWRQESYTDPARDIPNTFTFLGTRIDIPDIWGQAAEVLGYQAIEACGKTYHPTSSTETATAAEEATGPDNM